MDRRHHGVLKSKNYCTYKCLNPQLLVRFVAAHLSGFISPVRNPIWDMISRADQNEILLYLTFSCSKHDIHTEVSRLWEAFATRYAIHTEILCHYLVDIEHQLNFMSYYSKTAEITYPVFLSNMALGIFQRF